MVFADSLTKAGRLLEIQRMLAGQPSRGRTTREISYGSRAPMHVENATAEVAEVRRGRL